MLSTTLALSASLILLLANSFFVAAEFALLTVRPTRLSTLARSGNLRARSALRVSRHLQAYLSANQLGVTLASLGLGWLGEPALANVLEPTLQRLGVWSGLATHSIAAALALIAITLLHVVFGELVPKAIALRLTEPVALWTATPLHVFYVIAFPIIWVFNTIAQLVLRLLRLRTSTEAERFQSIEEIRLVLAHIALDPRARTLIDRIFDYTQRTAEQIMTLRRDVVVLHAERSFDENLQTALLNQFTRYPLVDAGDVPIGYVHIKDVTAALANGRRAVTIVELAREPVYTNKETKLEDLRREFQVRHVHVAMVRDSEERFVGIVTLEDLLEEFVGEIRDEQDVAEVSPIVRHGRDSFDIDARVTLDVAQRELGLGLANVSETAKTIGEYITDALDGAPRVGASIEAGCFLLTIAEMRERRVSRIHGEARERRYKPRSDL